MRTTKGPAKILTQDQAKAILAAATAKGPMARVTILLGLTAAMRAQELAGIRWADVCDSDGNLADVVTIPAAIGKGHKGRTVPMDPMLANALTAWREVSKYTKPTEPILPRTRGCDVGKPQTAHGMAVWLSDFFETAGIDASAHSLRRTAITLAARAALDEGVSLRDVQAFAGHVNFATTMIYLDPSEAGKRKLVAAVSAGLAG